MTQTITVSQCPFPQIFHVLQVLTMRTVGGVVNGDDDARGEDNLLPRLADVDYIDTVGPGLPQVRLHVHLEVLCAEMALGRKEHLDVRLGGVKDRGKVAGSHFDGFGTAEAGRMWIWCREVRDTTFDIDCGGGIVRVLSAVQGPLG
jgi:hypothetical protein